MAAVTEFCLLLSYSKLWFPSCRRNCCVVGEDILFIGWQTARHPYFYVCCLAGSGQRTGPATEFLTRRDPYAVFGLESVALVLIVTQWSGSGGIEASLGDQLASFSASMLFVGSSGL